MYAIEDDSVPAIDAADGVEIIAAADAVGDADAIQVADESIEARGSVDPDVEFVTDDGAAAVEAADAVEFVASADPDVALAPADDVEFADVVELDDVSVDDAVEIADVDDDAQMAHSIGGAIPDAAEFPDEPDVASSLASPAFDVGISSVLPAEPMEGVSQPPGAVQDIMVQAYRDGSADLPSQFPAAHDDGRAWADESIPPGQDEEQSSLPITDDEVIDEMRASSLPDDLPPAIDGPPSRPRSFPPAPPPVSEDLEPLSQDAPDAVQVESVEQAAIDDGSLDEVVEAQTVDSDEGGAYEPIDTAGVVAMHALADDGDAVEMLEAAAVVGDSSDIVDDGYATEIDASADLPYPDPADSGPPQGTIDEAATDMGDLLEPLAVSAQMVVAPDSVPPEQLTGAPDLAYDEFAAEMGLIEPAEIATIRPSKSPTKRKIAQLEAMLDRVHTRRREF